MSMKSMPMMIKARRGCCRSDDTPLQRFDVQQQKLSVTFTIVVVISQPFVPPLQRETSHVDIRRTT
jgi:hypothetical protein